MNDPFRAQLAMFHAQNTTVKVSDRTDRPITTIATVSDVQKIDIQGMVTDAPKNPAAPCATHRDSKPEPKAPKTNAPTSTIPTGKPATIAVCPLRVACTAGHQPPTQPAASTSDRRQLDVVSQRESSFTRFVLIPQITPIGICRPSRQRPRLHRSRPPAATKTQAAPASCGRSASG